MRSTFYRRYLQSQKWRRLRARRIFKDRGLCAECGSREKLEVHHLTYRRLGMERLDDLITLCQRHHRMYHQRRNQCYK